MNADQLVKLSSRIYLPDVSTKDDVKDNADGPGHNIHDYYEDFHHPHGICPNIESITRACRLRHDFS